VGEKRLGLREKESSGEIGRSPSKLYRSKSHPSAVRSQGEDFNEREAN